jgi:chemotaxis protein CheX
MTTDAAQDLQTQFPFAAMLRATDRDRLLVQLMASVWENILQLPAQNRDTAEADPHKPTDVPLLSAGVRITGTWEGLVTLAASRSLAAKCTAIMHQREADDLSEAEVRDGWGELANMVGGNLKALVPPESRLSLPEVGDATGYGGAEPGYRTLNTLTFACLGQRIRLSVLVPER